MTDTDEIIANNIARIAAARGALMAIGTDYGEGIVVSPHIHDRHQLLHALSGILIVSTASGHWIVPQDYALLIPAGCEHRVEMLSAVRMRSVYLRPGDLQAPSGDPRVLGMTSLVRALIIEAISLGPDEADSPRGQLLCDLLLHEIPRLVEQPLALPLPSDPRLVALCRGFIAAPDARAPLDDWANRAGMSRRSLTRHFRQETGLAVERWRQQACVFAALPRLIDGEKVTTVALDIGYDSPAAFTTMFRRMLGRTPRDYLRRA